MPREAEPVHNGPFDLVRLKFPEAAEELELRNRNESLSIESTLPQERHTDDGLEAGFTN
jgi:hypothetical protein